MCSSVCTYVLFLFNCFELAAAEDRVLDWTSNMSTKLEISAQIWLYMFILSLMIVILSMCFNKDATVPLLKHLLPLCLIHPAKSTHLIYWLGLMLWAANVPPKKLVW